jgi:hypothetical protein
MTHFFSPLRQKISCGPQKFQLLYQKVNFLPHSSIFRTPKFMNLTPPNTTFWEVKYRLFGGFHEIVDFPRKAQKVTFRAQKRCPIRVPKSDFSSPELGPQIGTPKTAKPRMRNCATGGVFRGGGAKVRNSPSGG